MRLSDLNPRWLGAGGEGVFRRSVDGALIPVPERRGVAIAFRCPCGGADCPDLRRGLGLPEDLRSALAAHLDDHALWIAEQVREEGAR